jgi:excinuclease ABC subunit A
MGERVVAAATDIVVRGARTHNLKNIDVSLPLGRLIVVTGVSGSGKSSLAFDTIYAEGQRRYVSSLSAYARQFLERMEKPDVDHIDGICPAIAIRQKNSIRNPRSTVGTTTEIHDYLRLLFARIGRTFCRQCGQEVVRDTAEIVARQLGGLPEGTRLLIGFEMPIVDAAGVAEGTDAEGESEDPDTTFRDWPAVAKGYSDARSTEDAARASNGSVTSTLNELRRKGFHRLYVHGRTVALDDVSAPDLRNETKLKVIVDRVKVEGEMRTRLTDSIETAYREAGGTALAIEDEGGASGATGEVGSRVHIFSERFECQRCKITYEAPQPRLFSFNNPFGACPTCHGFGNIIELDLDLVVPDQNKSIQQGAIEPWTKTHYRAQLAELKRAAKSSAIRLDVAWKDLTDNERQIIIEGDGKDYEGIRGFFRWLERKKYKVHVRVFLSRYRGYLTCPECGGARLRREARDVRVGGRTIDQVSSDTVREAQDFLESLRLTEKEAAIGDKVLKEIQKRLKFLSDVGLDYLTLDRLSSTLSGGESQRINLATSLGSSLVDTLYVLDEPSIGLHSRDNQRLINILRQLRDQGNTVLVVEHDEDMIRVGDAIVDLGLGAGEQGGRVVFSGPLQSLLEDQRSLTAKYLRGDLAIPVPSTRRRGSGQKLRILGASEHNLKKIDVEIPLNTLTCITGVSGSGKSTLVHDVLYSAVKRAKGGSEKRVGAHRKVEGTEFVSDVVLVDQTPIGRTPRSNPVTYLKAFDPIRDIFAATKDAKSRGLTASHFSFNVPGGRCEACQGEGEVRVEMQFLADVFVPCDQCDGKRFKPEILEVKYRGKNVNQVLDLTVREALAFFSTSPKVLRRLHVLDDMGLGYLRLWHPATSLSGCEAKRFKIASLIA